MKRMLVIFLVAVVLLTTGCSDLELFPELFAGLVTVPEATPPADTLPPETDPPQTEPPETDPPETEPPIVQTTDPTEPLQTSKPTQQQSRFPYIIYVDDPNKPIYGGPGYNYSFEGTVEIAALYTIMEERTDSYGNLWGRLKSGAGWIVLNEGFEPYLVYVDDPDWPIYSGPGFGYSCVGTVEIAAQYTIVEERYDYAGNLWGRLKSGAGWIYLSWY